MPWHKDDAGEIQLTAFHHRNPVVRGHMAQLAPTATHSTEQGLLPFVWQLDEPLLIEVADRLATAVKSSPRAGWATLARLGDEFAVLLADVRLADSGSPDRQPSRAAISRRPDSMPLTLPSA